LATGRSALATGARTATKHGFAEQARSNGSCRIRHTEFSKRMDGPPHFKLQVCALGAWHTRSAHGQGACDCVVPRNGCVSLVDLKFSHPKKLKRFITVSSCAVTPQVPWLPQSQGKRSDALVELVDVFPTMIDLSGTPKLPDKTPLVRHKRGLGHGNGPRECWLLSSTCVHGG
jgi:hypothetical protein